MSDEFPSVISIIAREPDGLTDRIVGIFLRDFSSGGKVGPVSWLSPRRACDIPFMLNDPAAQSLLEQSISKIGKYIDVNIVKTRARRKRLLIADMDSTIIGCECLDELADEAGIKPQIAAITERAMRGEILFEPALRERVGLLKGLSLSALEATYKRAVKLNPGAKALVATMKRNGARALLVSGGFTFFTSRVAREVGFDEQQANVLLDDGAALTGKVREPILGREAKLEALKAAIAQLNITPDDALAVGDGANDLAMIQYAGLGVAYHAKPIVAEAASASIDHGDLRGLLYLQGYRDEEIVDN